MNVFERNKCVENTQIRKSGNETTKFKGKVLGYAMLNTSYVYQIIK